MSGDTIKMITAIVIFVSLAGVGFYFLTYKPKINCELKSCPDNRTPTIIEGNCLCVIKAK